MRISGTKPSSMILSKTNWPQKLKNYVQKEPIKLQPKVMMELIHKITISMNF